MDHFHVLSKKRKIWFFSNLSLGVKVEIPVLEAEHVEVNNIEPVFW